MPQTAPEPYVTVHTFLQRFSSTPRGARLARHLAAAQLDGWGVPYGTTASDTVALIVGELCANAVTHGRVPGRDFELRLEVCAPQGRTGRTLRVAVTDTRGDRRPPTPDAVAQAPSPPPPLADTGRGLHLVAALAARWSVTDRPSGAGRRDSGPGKTVTAEVDLPH